MLHRLAEHIWPCKLYQINADPKGNQYRLARKQVEEQTVHGSEGSTKTGPGGDKQIGRGVRKGYYLSPNLFNVYSKYLIEEALEGFGDLKIGEKFTCTMKYVDDFELLDKAEMV